ncbi:MAG TPA: TOPRIM nucleotidyl transferase/hydrolase domain-containing protein [Candidatus Nitrosotenuis sp.]|jgi:hypothetical protein|nr:TOPRIM nucleotidyl transferase/hydrolase domain-containing protein [Candidatus Nitrosotenuis sp.]
MKQETFAYYIRKKLAHRFTQGKFMQPRDFVKFLKDHGFDVDERTLERYEKEGWMQPVLRLIIPEENRDKGLILGIEGIKAFYKDKFVEFPKKGDYEPWSNFHEKDKFHDKKLIFYHSFQILQIQNILRHKKFSFTYYDSHTDEDIQKIVSRIKDSREWNKKSFSQWPKSQIENIGLLMLLEEPYRYQSFASMTTPLFRKGDGFKAWVRWRKTKFSAHKLLKESGLTVEQVKKLYNHFAIDGHHLDPLERWYDLTRIMRRSVTDKLKGEALLAQFYYKICRMLGHFIYDLTKEIMPEPDTIFDASGGEWKKRIYSDPFDYSTRKTQRGIIKYFTRDTNMRILLLLEGDTEVEVVKKICERLDVNLEDDGILLINYEGISNLTPGKRKDAIKISTQDNVPMFIIADNECNAKEKILKIKSVIKAEFDFHVWNKSFEEDNFGFNRIFDYLSEVLKKQGKELTKKEIRKYQKRGNTLMTSIEKAYGEKYRDDIYRTISKSNISLELMKNRLKKISRDKKKGKPYPIEKVMERVFQMIPYWG